MSEQSTSGPALPVPSLVLGLDVGGRDTDRFEHLLFDVLAAVCVPAGLAPVCITTLVVQDPRGHYAGAAQLELTGYDAEPQAAAQPDQGGVALGTRPPPAAPPLGPVALAAAVYAEVTRRTGAAVGLCVVVGSAGEPEVTTRLGPRELVEGAALAAVGLFERTAGRAVLFPGEDQLTGTVALEQLDRLSAIGGLYPVGGPPEPGAMLRTFDFVRPEFRGGGLVLTVRPALGGTWAPFESEAPHECCETPQDRANHATLRDSVRTARAALGSRGRPPADDPLRHPVGATATRR